MGKIPNELRATIAANIKMERLKKFPGRGGGKKCSEALGVSPQQWSPWERGVRLPDETRLEQIADFFGVTVEYLRRPGEQKKISFQQWGTGIRLTAISEENTKHPFTAFNHQQPENLPPVNITSGLAERKRHAVETFCKCIYDMMMLGIRVDVAPILSIKGEEGN